VRSGHGDRARAWPVGPARWQLNRVVVAVSLCILLPLVALVERVRRGHGELTARGAVGAVARLCGVFFEVRPRAGDRSGPVVYTPNHSSPIDIPAMLLAAPEARFLAAADLFRLPLLAGAMRALGTFPINRRDPDVARRQMSQLAESFAAGDGFDVVIFPEGGIAPTARLLPFKAGAFILAIQTGSPVVPVALHHARDVLPPHGRLALRPGTVVVEMLDPIDTTGLTFADRGALRDRVRSAVEGALRAGPQPRGPGA